MWQSVHMQNTTVDASERGWGARVKLYDVKNKIHKLGGKMQSLSSAPVV